MRTLISNEVSLVSGGDLTNTEKAGIAIGALGIGGYAEVFAFSFAKFCYALPVVSYAGIGAAAAVAVVGPIVGGLIGYGAVVAGSYAVDALTATSAKS